MDGRMNHQTKELAQTPGRLFLGHLLVSCDKKVTASKAESHYQLAQQWSARKRVRKGFRAVMPDTSLRLG
jgi:hypothetical protein